MRLDKYLSDLNLGTRSQIKSQIRGGQITVNGKVTTKADFPIDEAKDCVTYLGRPLVYEKYVYYMLNKPSGVVSATRDSRERTVLDLMGDISRKDIFPAGRLDKDTEGLLLLTNDGRTAHHLLSPRKHVGKVYYVNIHPPLTEEALHRLETGIDIGDKTMTLPAGVQLLDECELLITIREGRYHQVKRMLKAAGSEVLYLKRIAFGPLTLDPSLQPGEFRTLTREEINILLKTVNGDLYDDDK